MNIADERRTGISARIRSGRQGQRGQARARLYSSMIAVVEVEEVVLIVVGALHQLALAGCMFHIGAVQASVRGGLLRLGMQPVHCRGSHGERRLRRRERVSR